MNSPSVNHAAIVVFGVGGAGINSVMRMQQARIPGVSYVTVNASGKCADGAAHINLLDPHEALSGCGGDPGIGKSLAEKKKNHIREALRNQDLMIMVAGQGRGTGTGAGIVVAQAAREAGLLTAGVVSMPFAFEGRRRMATAQEGLDALLGILDCVIVIHNDNLLKCSDRDLSIEEALLFADDTLRKAVQGISDLVMIPGDINIDFADLKTTISESGRAIIGMGEASGQNRAMDALDLALKSPLLDMGLEGARRVLLNITGGADLTLHEASRIGSEIAAALKHLETNIIWGTATDQNYHGKIKITVFATDFSNDRKRSALDLIESSPR